MMYASYRGGIFEGVINGRINPFQHGECDG